MPGLASHLVERFRARGTMTVLEGNARCARERWTGDELADAVEAFAAGLFALGVRRGDRVALIADNHDLWLAGDLAVLALGAADVPRAADASPAEIAFVVEHSESRILLVEDQALWTRVAAEIDKAGRPRTVIVLKGPAPSGTLSFAEVSERGRAASAAARADFDAARRAVEPADLATIVYTSGTTGNPKGVMLTHANVLHNVRVLPSLVDITPDDKYLSFLPSWHTFERTFSYCVLAAGAVMTYSTKAALRKDLVRVRPTLVAGVPRLWETMTGSLLSKLEKAPRAAKAIARLALRASERYVLGVRRRRGQLVDERYSVAHATPMQIIAHAAAWPVIWPLHRLADALVYRKLRDATGGRIRFLVSGGGALPAHVDELINRAGICLLNGYGLTETAPVVSVRLPQRNILTTAGQPLPDTHFRVMDEEGAKDLGRRAKGVLWIKGPQIMQGYFKNADATTAVLRDGWFNSGDLAVLTDQDDVIICGRMKDTVVLRGGENVEPETIEAELVRSPLIADAVVVGHAQKHLAALIVPNPDGIGQALPQAGEAGGNLCTASVESLIRAEVSRLISPDRGYRVFERVPKIACLPEPFSVEAGTLTATMKKRRHVIEERYAAEIRRLFADGDDGE
jgi:long-chain acyl-CoA synthetase